MEAFIMPLFFFLAHMINAVSRVTDDLAEIAVQKENIKRAKRMEFLSHSSNVLTWFFVAAGFYVSISYDYFYMWYWYSIILFFTRSFYDYLTNYLRGNSFDYRGSAFTDKILIWLGVPEYFFIMIRIIAIILAFTFAYRYHL